MCKPGGVGRRGGDRQDAGRRHVLERRGRHRLPAGRLRHARGGGDVTGLHPVRGRADQHGGGVERAAHTDVLDGVAARRPASRCATAPSHSPELSMGWVDPWVGLGHTKWTHGQL